MSAFFSELAFVLPARSLQKGLNYILEETYEDSSLIFPVERKSLFINLLEAENKFDWYCFHPIDTEKLDEMLNNKAFNIPKNSSHFISQIFPDTMVVDKFAAVRHLLICEYPFDHEVKGLTRYFVERVKAALAAENSGVSLSALAQESNTSGSLHESPTNPAQGAAPSASRQEHIQNNKDTILIPRALWEHREPQQVCVDMRVAGYTDDAPIAHALYY